MGAIMGFKREFHVASVKRGAGELDAMWRSCLPIAPDTHFAREQSKLNEGRHQAHVKKDLLLFQLHY